MTENELFGNSEQLNDLISRQAAIDALGEKPEGDDEWSSGCRNQWEWDTEILKTMPPAQPEKRTDKRTVTHACDLISRQAAIDKAITIPIAKIVTEDKVIYRRIVFIEDIENLPPARSEIIRCKDCKHIRKWRSEESAKKFGQVYECVKKVFGCPKPEDFCSFAERRTDG